MSITITGSTLGQLPGNPVSISLNDLSNVSIVSPQDTQTLIYNSDTGYWQNGILGTQTYQYLSTSMTGLRGVEILYNSSANTIQLSLGDITPDSVAATGTVTGSNLSGTNTGDQTIILTGDISGTGTGLITTTLSTVNTDVGTYGSSSLVPVLTVDSKGRITNVSTVLTGTVTSISATGNNGILVSGSPVTSDGNIVLGLGDITPTSVTATGTVTGSNLSGTNTGDQTITLTGDVSGSGTGSISATLSTVNTDVGTYGSSTSIPVVTVNSKGLITSVSTVTFSGTSPLSASLEGGTAGNIPYQTSTSTTSFIPTGTSSQVLMGGATPSWTSSPAIVGTNFTSIPNGALLNNSITVGTTVISLGSSTTTLAGLTSVTSTTFNATSTKRVKKKITTLSNSYKSKFHMLKPREYDRTDYTAHEFGFIAEEMNLVYPEIVGKDATGIPTGIDYGKLSAILTAKVQDQDKEIKELKQTIAEILSILKSKE